MWGFQSWKRLPKTHTVDVTMWRVRNTIKSNQWIERKDTESTRQKLTSLCPSAPTNFPTRSHFLFFHFFKFHTPNNVPSECKILNKFGILARACNDSQRTQEFWTMKEFWKQFVQFYYFLETQKWICSFFIKIGSNYYQRQHIPFLEHCVPHRHTRNCNS